MILQFSLNHSSVGGFRFVLALQSSKSCNFFFPFEISGAILQWMQEPNSIVKFITLKSNMEEVECKFEFCREDATNKDSHRKISSSSYLSQIFQNSSSRPH